MFFMKKKYINPIIFSFLLFLNFSFSNSQIIVDNSNKQIDIGVTCSMPIPTEVNRIYIPPPSNFIKEESLRRSTTCSNIEVTYNGFPTDIFGNPGEAQLAFQFAIDIWETLIESPVTIRIDATFAFSSIGNLGSAGPTFFSTIPGGDPNTLYPGPLAEKLTGSDLNGSNSADINSNFNSGANWYFGTDGNPSNTQIDFVSVVLHEIGHGLGILGFSFENNALGYVRRESSGTNLSFDGSSQFNSIWDTFIDGGDIFGNPVPILNTNNFPEASSQMLNALTSNNLTCNSSTAIAQNGGVRPKTFAPGTYNQGSSYSHWDETTFNNTPHALMTPQLANGEAVHDPGNITLGFMEDMGWSLCQGTLSTNDFVLDNIKLSPNPFTDIIKIEIPSSLTNQSFNVNITDINGRVVLSQKENVATNGEINIDNLTNLTNSLYFLTIESTTSDLAITKKIIKK